MDLRERELAASGLCDGLELSYHAAWGGLDLRERELAASRLCASGCTGTRTIELHHGAAGRWLVLRQWWLGAAELAVRTDGRVRWRRPRPWLGVHRSGWLGATKSSARGWRRGRLTPGIYGHGLHGSLGVRVIRVVLIA